MLEKARDGARSRLSTLHGSYYAGFNRYYIVGAIAGASHLYARARRNIETFHIENDVLPCTESEQNFTMTIN